MYLNFIGANKGEHDCKNQHILPFVWLLAINIFSENGNFKSKQ